MGCQPISHFLCSVISFLQGWKAPLGDDTVTTCWPGNECTHHNPRNQCCEEMLTIKIYTNFVYHGNDIMLPTSVRLSFGWWGLVRGDIKFRVQTNTIMRIWLTLVILSGIWGARSDRGRVLYCKEMKRLSSCVSHPGACPEAPSISEHTAPKSQRSFPGSGLTPATHTQPPFARRRHVLIHNGCRVVLAKSSIGAWSPDLGYHTAHVIKPFQRSRDSLRGREGEHDGMR